MKCVTCSWPSPLRIERHGHAVYWNKIPFFDKLRIHQLPSKNTLQYFNPLFFSLLWPIFLLFYGAPGYGQKGLSIRPSVWKFSGMDLLGFSKFWHDVRNPCKIVCDSWIFLNKKKWWMLQKWGKWAKHRVFWIYWKIWSYFFWIRSLIKVCIICCISNPHILEKSRSWDMGQNALCQLDCRISNQLYLLKKMMKWSDFLHVDTNSWKLKVDWKILW